MQANLPESRPRPMMLRRVKAFTLVELLVVIAIVVVLMAVAFPSIAVMNRLTRGGAAQTTIGIAARTAAAYASRPAQSISNTLSTEPAILTTNGAAVLFTPSGNIRILETDLNAKDTTGPTGKYLQSTATPPAPSPLRFGYQDVADRDYIHMPANVGIVGILRDSTGVKLITPPFAIHFNKFGQATTGYVTNTVPGDQPQMVYYDSNYDKHYNTTSTRAGYAPPTSPSVPGITSSLYNPDEWNDKRSGWDGTKMDDAGIKPHLPFEAIETVVGVLVFQVDDLRSGDGTTLTLKSQSPNGFLNDDAANWLLATKPDGTLKNAKTLFFSRNSGTMLKEYR